MSRSSSVITVLGCLSLVGCGSAEDGDSAVEEAGLQPQAGDWTIITTGWSNDDCNAEETFTAPNSIAIADVDDSSFRITYFEEGVQVGSNVICTHEADDVYSCEDYTNGFSFTDVDASISMVATGSITVTSETEAAGYGDFIVDCEDQYCSQLETTTTSGVYPCGTTMNWTAKAD